MASNQIFLHITGGRTVWVPAHKAAAYETKPVQLLSSVTPMELSRSFYLYDYAIQVVDDLRQAAVSPNCKTPQDIIVAVNEFRRACQTDQSYLFQRCYDPKRPPVAMPHPNQLQNAIPQITVGTGNDMNASKTGGIDLLTQLLQQRQQQQPMMPNSLINMNSPLDASASTPSTASGSVLGNPGGAARFIPGPGASMGNYPCNISVGSGANPMLFVGAGGMPQGGTPGFDQASMMMMMGGNGGGAANGNVRRGTGNFNPNNMSGAPSNNMFFGSNSGMLPPMMMMPQTPFGFPNTNTTNNNNMSGNMHAALANSNSSNPNSASNSNNNNNNNASSNRVGPFNGEARREPEPVAFDIQIPDEIRTTYMNPAQSLVCATMPGPRITVWLREHPIPESKKDPKYVFCKGGIVLMLKAQGAEVKDSKPVELFSKQICTHFLIHGYCSRTHCLHEHHSEEQLRLLIAVRHVQLKAMTRKERHRLIDEIMEKEKEGIRVAEEERETRQRERQERLQSHQHTDYAKDNGKKNTNGESEDAEVSLAQRQVPSSNFNSLDKLSDDDDDGGDNATKGAVQKTTKEEPQESKKKVAAASHPHVLPVNIHRKTPTPVANVGISHGGQLFGGPKSHINAADIGVTDSDGEDSTSSDSSSKPTSSESQSESDLNDIGDARKQKRKRTSKLVLEAVEEPTLQKAATPPDSEVSVKLKQESSAADIDRQSGDLPNEDKKNEEDNEERSEKAPDNTSIVPEEEEKHDDDAEVHNDGDDEEQEEQEELASIPKAGKAPKAAPKKATPRKAGKPEPKKRCRAVSAAPKKIAKKAKK